VQTPKPHPPPPPPPPRHCHCSREESLCSLLSPAVFDFSTETRITFFEGILLWSFGRLVLGRLRLAESPSQGTVEIVFFLDSTRLAFVPPSLFVRLCARHLTSPRFHVSFLVQSVMYGHRDVGVTIRPGLEGLLSSARGPLFRSLFCDT